MSDGGKRWVRLSARILLALVMVMALAIGGMWTALWAEKSRHAKRFRPGHRP